MRSFARVLVGLLLTAAALSAQTKAPAKTNAKAANATQSQPAEACAACIRAQETFLASDALRGRGSATHDEELAANYIASELLRYGIAAAVDNGGYVQVAKISKHPVAGAPTLTFSVNNTETKWTHGKEIIVLTLMAADVSGPLQKLASIADAAQVQRGAVVLAPAGTTFRNAAAIVKQGAAAALLPAPQRAQSNWAELAQRPLELGETEFSSGTALLLNDAAHQALAALPEGTTITIHAEPALVQEISTYNAVGVLRGSDPQLTDQAVLLTAHLDHLGVGRPVNGDSIYNGANDDASGCVAVLEMARVLGAGAKPKRTVVFAFFGSEETGGQGAAWFLEHPPVPIAKMVANLEFEVIGAPDPLYAPDELWLTGWERSNLGPTLRQHGAKLQPDRRPEQNFFQRSDNYALAKRGVVAQTVSSSGSRTGLYPEYHRPNDDVQHIDFEHMTRAIASMLGPVRWLVDSDFVPAWNPGQKP